MKDSLLITGGSGLLGVNWALTMRESCIVTLGLHSRCVRAAAVATRELRLDSADSVARALDEVRPQLVVHTAGLTNVETCEADPERARHVNVELTANVARACADAGVRLVHISTDHLFPGTQPFVTEGEPVAPVNTYGATKAEAEQRALAACADTLVVRTNFYGWGPSYRRSFSDSVIAPLRAGERVTLFADVFYTPILIEELVKTVHGLVARGATGIFNVAGDERISKYEFGLRLAAKFGLDAGLIRRGLLADSGTLVTRPHDMSLANDKAATVLGRKLGGVDEHIARLYAQEHEGLAREVRTL